MLCAVCLGVGGGTAGPQEALSPHEQQQSQPRQVLTELCGHVNKTPSSEAHPGRKELLRPLSCGSHKSVTGSQAEKQRPESTGAGPAICAMTVHSPGSPRALQARAARARPWGSERRGSQDTPALTHNSPPGVCRGRATCPRLQTPGTGGAQCLPGALNTRDARWGSPRPWPSSTRRRQRWDAGARSPAGETQHRPKHPGQG